MYSMIIADDEAIERVALKLLIKRNLPEVNVLEDAENGIDFLNKAERLKPDISIVDINMPGIDGLQAIRELKQRNINTKVIIQSAHNSFQYAQQAVSLGATEYLLKPVKREKLISIIKKNIESIEKDREKEREAHRLKKAINDVSQTIETDFLSSLLTGDINKCNLLKNYMDILGANANSGIILTVCLPESNINIAESVGDFIVDYLNKEGGNIYSCVSSSIKNNKISFLIRTRTNDDFNRWIETLTDNLERKVNLTFNVNIKAEIESLLENIQSTSLRNAMNSISNDVDINEAFSASDYKQKFHIFEQQFVRYIAAADLENGSKLIEELVVEMYNGNLENFKVVVSVLLSAVLKSLISNNLYDKKDFSGTVVHEMTSIDSLSGIKQYLYNLLRLLVVEIDSNKNNKISKLVRNAIEYINDHYFEDISLTKAAEKIGITPYYLSRLFKQELNENFVDYITKIRIEQAINLLIQDNERPIKELADSVGYKNSTYFCKVFKKVTGKTVKDYKKDLISKT